MTEPAGTRIPRRRPPRPVVTPKGTFPSAPAAAAVHGLSRQRVAQLAQRGTRGWYFEDTGPSAPPPAKPWRRPSRPPLAHIAGLKRVRQDPVPVCARKDFVLIVAEDEFWKSERRCTTCARWLERRQARLSAMVAKPQWWPCAHTERLMPPAAAPPPLAQPLHTPHPDPAIEARAQELYAAYCTPLGLDAATWDRLEDPSYWWALAEKG